VIILAKCSHWKASDESLVDTQEEHNDITQILSYPGSDSLIRTIGPSRVDPFAVYPVKMESYEHELVSRSTLYSKLLKKYGFKSDWSSMG
jgi:hypothetical protein